MSRFAKISVLLIGFCFGAGKTVNADGLPIDPREISSSNFQVQMTQKRALAGSIRTDGQMVIIVLDYAFFFFVGDAEQAKMYEAMALTAKAQGKTLKVHYDTYNWATLKYISDDADYYVKMLVGGDNKNGYKILDLQF